VSIEVRGITKRFGEFHALDRVNFRVESGELVALLGPSGSGKTTLLRIIAGLDFADEGTIYVNEQEVTGQLARERRMGFVFQHYALFRHMTVFENVAFGLRVKRGGARPPEPVIREKVFALLKLVQLDWMAERYPSQLSGGQRQRVALARALAVEPTVLLLDEPFGALDAKVRQELRRWLRQLHDEIHLTSVFVTHDQDEAMEVSDRIVVMNHGRIEQVGSPEELYDRPANTFVHHFLGNINAFRGQVADGKVWIGRLGLLPSEPPPPGATDATIYIRPHQLEIERDAAESQHFKATVQHVHPIGPLVKVDLVSEQGDAFAVEMTQQRQRKLQLKKGAQVFIASHESTAFVEYLTAT